MKATILRLYKGVKIDENNVTNLSSNDLLESLETYKVAEYSDLSLVLSNFTLRVDESYFDVKECNYMAFLNRGYTTKWYFAYIREIKYISDRVTEIKFSFDFWSTYHDNFNWLDCFVEREITASDNIGEHTLDEGLNVGRVETLEVHQENIQGDVDSNFWVGLYSDYDVESNDTFTGNIAITNSNVTGHQLMLFRILVDDEYIADCVNYIRYYLLKASVEGRIEDVKDMFIIPDSLVNQTLLDFHDVQVTFGQTTRNIEYYTFNSDIIGAGITDISFAKKLNWSDFIPKNNKCYCYPYNFLYLTNNIGNQNIFKYEDFDGQNATFRMEKVLSIGGSCRIYPTNYKGLSKDIDEQISCSKFPTCGWSADSYTNWLTQNAINLTSQLVGVAGQTIGAVWNTGVGMIAESEGYISEMGVKGLASAGQGILNFIGQFRKADLMPNIEGGSQNNGDVSFASGSNNFKFEMKRSRLEDLKIIDDYFTKFGYKIARVKKPNITISRFNHFYIKTGQGEKALSGDIPKDGIDVLNTQISKGITIWKSLANIGNYNEGE